MNGKATGCAPPPPSLRGGEGHALSPASPHLGRHGTHGPQRDRPAADAGRTHSGRIHGHVVIALGQLKAATGPELGDVLRRQAHLLAYHSALAHARDLNRIEAALMAAVLRHAARSDPVHDYALDVVRTHMVRGLIEAAQRTGTSTVFWRDP